MSLECSFWDMLVDTLALPDSTQFLRNILQSLDMHLDKMPEKYSVTSLLDTWVSVTPTARAPPLHGARETKRTSESSAQESGAGGSFSIEGIGSVRPPRKAGLDRVAIPN
uniref:Putative positive cofactor 2 subunit of a rna polymerase ii multiprotein coactivator n=1 Tax=Ixodes ricinus TaxID=34613 RepID=A0A0K8R6G8_IXORI